MVYIVKTDNQGEMLEDELWNVWQELQLQTFSCSVRQKCNLKKNKNSNIKKTPTKHKKTSPL